MVLMIDNYDSFTYNLVQYLCELGAEVEVQRNDQISLSEIETLKPTHIVISPGPGTPDTAGIAMSAIAHFAGRVPVFGVCLGMQAIGQVFGGVVQRASRVMHGKTSPIYHEQRGVFRGLPSPYTATRYHSLVVEAGTVPAALEVTAWTQDGAVTEIMGLQHKEFNVSGVQFHPESLASEHGHAMLKNFLDS